MQIIVKATDPKHRRRLEYWTPFLLKLFDKLKEISPEIKLPEEVIFKPLKPRRLPHSEVRLNSDWAIMGCTFQGEWWIGMDMRSPTHKFKDSLFHEVAHFGAVLTAGDWKCKKKGKRGGELWENFYKRLKEGGSL
jgi:hypothetical protein